MFTTLDAFLAHWQYEAAATQQLMDALTDASLAQGVGPSRRTLGRLAWHVAGSLPEMANRTGLGVGGMDEHAPVPSSARDISVAYAAASASLQERLRAAWTDESLAQEHDMYGEQWSRAKVLTVLVLHQVHHRGQMTVLMRQAGLTVPGVYGPAEEEWAAMGMQAPVV